MVQLNDVTLRDGHQSLLSGRLRHEDIDMLAPILDQVGFDRCEVWGGTTYEIPVTFKGEDPWDNLDKIRRAMPNTKLSMLVRGQSLVSRTIQADETVKLFIKKSAEHGINIFRVFDALNDFDNVKPTLDAIRVAKQAGHDVSAEGTISYTDPVAPPNGDVIHTLDSMVALAHRFVEEGDVDTLCIKDMAGLLTAEKANALVKRLKDEFPNTPLVLHTHATMGRSDAAIKAAIEAGVDQVDTASAGLAYGSGQSATEDILAWLKQHHPEKAPQLNEEKLVELNSKLMVMRPRYAAYEAKHFPPDVEALLRDAQVPGGMVTTMDDLIKKGLGQAEAHLYDRVFTAALKEMPVVRAEAGYPPLVTPTSQVVMTQAVFNAVNMVRAHDAGVDPADYRYKALHQDFTTPPRDSLNPEFANLIQGRFGKLPAAPSAELQTIAAAMQNIAPLAPGKRAADVVAIDLNAQRTKLAVLLECDVAAVTDEDLLTSILAPKGTEFLLHKHGIHSKQFEALPPLPAMPESALYRDKPHTGTIAAIALPYVDALLHVRSEGMRTSKESELHGLLGERADALKDQLFMQLREQGGFAQTLQLIAIERQLNALIAERGELFGLKGNDLPSITYADMKAHGQNALALA